MKISVTRSGGIAGMTRTWTATAQNPEEEQRWRELIDRLPWESDSAPATEPDRFVYRVRWAHREAVVPEQRFTGAWQELLDEVRETEDGGIP